MQHKFLKAMGAVLLFCSFAAPAFADSKKDYKAFADGIRKEVWEMELPQFKAPATPQQYNKTSAVILASYTGVEITRRMGFNLHALFFASSTKSRKVFCNYLQRDLIHINDQAALKKYSSFDNKVMDTSYRSGLREDRKRVLGVRIVKANGEIRNIDTDDFVSDLEGKKGQEETQKLAVPGLAIGDNIDIFVYTRTELQLHNFAPFVFFLRHEYPCVWQKIHCDIDKDFYVKYRSWNGAPDFVETKNADGDYLLDLEVKNNSTFTPDLFYRYERQTPMVMLDARTPIKNTLVLPSMRTRGLEKNPNPEWIAEDAFKLLNNYMKQYYFVPDNKIIIQGSRAKRRIKDEVQRADSLYNMFWFNNFKDNFACRDGDYFAHTLSSYFKHAGIEHQLMFTTLKRTQDVSNLVSANDTYFFVKLKNHDKYYFFFIPTSMSAGEIPALFQGRRAYYIADKKKKPGEGKYATITLPINKPAENSDVIDLDVTLNNTSLNVEHTEAVTGAIKEDMQDGLTTLDEIYDSFRNRMKVEKDLADVFGKRYAKARNADLEAMEKQRNDAVKEYLKAYFDEPVKDLSNYKVLAVGNQQDSIAFTFTVRYGLDGFVKKAGNNFILSLGKLLGDAPKIEGTERQRTLDVNMNCPKEVKWNITVNLPQGYEPSKKSLQELNSRVDNSFGSFITTAKTEPGKLILQVTKTYKVLNLPVSAWQQLLDVYDARAQFGTRQIVLSKKP